MEVLLACVLFYCVMIYFLTLTFITQQSKSAIVGIRNLSRETSKIVLAKYIKSPFNCKKDILIFNSNKYKGDKKRKNKYSYFLVRVFFFFFYKKQLSRNNKTGKTGNVSDIPLRLSHSGRSTRSKVKHAVYFFQELVKKS